MGLIPSPRRSAYFQLGGDPNGSGRGRLVLPDTDHKPTIVRQRRVHPAIAARVGIELRTPVASVRLGICRVLGASVPKAAIDVDRHALPGEDNVGTGPHAAGMEDAVLAEAQSQAMKL
jgi:hypothetical protein